MSSLDLLDLTTNQRPCSLKSGKKKTKTKTKGYIVVTITNLLTLSFRNKITLEQACLLMKSNTILP